MGLKDLIEGVLDKLKDKIVYDLSEYVLFVGDLHGDIDSIKKISHISKIYERVVFLGDYVDRGENGYETLIEVLKLLKERDNVVLLKGNHEDLNMNVRYGFYLELLEKEPSALKPLEVFYKKLPLVYVNPKLGVFAVHGGIGNVPNNLRELTEQEESLVWSDFNWENPLKTEENVYRGIGYLFGLDILKPFMEKFGFKYFVRSHEYFEDGYRIYRFDGKYLITIFSSNANGYGFVKRKMLEISKEGYRIIPF